MTIKDFYCEIHGDYQEILGRLATDDRIKRFLIKFLDTDDMSQLKEAWKNEDADRIFSYSHRLKGIALNLSLNNFANFASNLTEQYRDGSAKDFQMASQYFNQCCDEYELIAANIKKLD